MINAQRYLNKYIYKKDLSDPFWRLTDCPNNLEYCFKVIKESKSSVLVVLFSYVNYTIPKDVKWTILKRDIHD